MTDTSVISAPAEHVAELPEIDFPVGLPGFPESTRFALVRWGGDPVLSVLVDIDHPGVRFLVVPPDVFFAAYEVELPDSTCALIDLQRPDDALLLVILTLAADGTATANLLGPLVINTATCRGVQAVLADSGYAARTALPVA